MVAHHRYIKLGTIEFDELTDRVCIKLLVKLKKKKFKCGYGNVY